MKWQSGGISRRRVLGTMTLAGLAGYATSGRAVAGDAGEEGKLARALGLASNLYVWGTFGSRAGTEFGGDWARDIKTVAGAPVAGFEPSFASVDEVASAAAAAREAGLEMQSIYLNSTLHETDAVEKSIEEVVEIAISAHALMGTWIVVTNPAPIQWGQQAFKSDAQLRTQAAALDSLGGRLKEHGITLAYHNHDIEFGQGGREFHHMLGATDPERVSFCLDAHWIFRGCGNSELGLFDVLDRFAERIVEVHLRQSHQGIWSEVFESGDIDYARIGKTLEQRGVRPMLVLEQAVEPGSPHTMGAAEAHRKSLAYVAECFSGENGNR